VGWEKRSVPDNLNSDVRDQVKLTNDEHFYQIKDDNEQLIDYEEATGRELFNHYRHRMTNYDQVLDWLRHDQGHVTSWQQKKATAGVAEQVLEKYRDEHIKVIRDSQKKNQFLKTLMQKVGVSTASALINLLDSWSDKIKEISHLESSRSSLQVWNDTYRVQ
jgi:hypothetical protein